MQESTNKPQNTTLDRGTLSFQLLNKHHHQIFVPKRMMLIHQPITLNLSLKKDPNAIPKGIYDTLIFAEECNVKKPQT